MGGVYLNIYIDCIWLPPFSVGKEVDYHQFKFLKVICKTSRIILVTSKWLDVIRNHG